MLNEARIAISGKSGCGNTTVSRLVADRSGLRVINYTFHNMAEEFGISFEDLCLRAEADPKYDRKLDQRQVRLAREPGCVLGSRLAIWLLEDADLKVYLAGEREVRAGRIAMREGIDLQKALSEMNARDGRDHERYLRLYGIDIDDYAFADLVIDTADEDQFHVADRIVFALEAKPGSAL